MERRSNPIPSVSGRLPLAAVGLMCAGLAACGWILGIEDFSPQTDRDASFVESSTDSYASLDSQEQDTQPIPPATGNSDADLGNDADLAPSTQGPRSGAATDADGSEPPPDAGGSDGTATPDSVAPPDAQPGVGFETDCRRLLQCCAGLILPRQLAAACLVASLADAGKLCSAGLGALGDAGLCR